MIRRLLAFLLLTIGLPATAIGGDAASVDILGFSSDGRVFAFEEYGVQDGSGFPYANRYYIDTQRDAFVSGTPIRVRIDDERSSVDEARRRARERGQAIISDNVLARNRGYTAAWNPVTELSADPFRVVANPRPVFPPIDDPVEFRLEEYSVEAPSRCRDLGDIKGFRLMRPAIVPGVRAVLVHEDSAVPSSRGCPLGYAIGGLQTFFPRSGSPVFAVIIAVRQFGFEGPDHRWMAVTGRL